MTFSSMACMSCKKAPAHKSRCFSGGGEYCMYFPYAMPEKLYTKVDLYEPIKEPLSQEFYDLLQTIQDTYGPDDFIAVSILIEVFKSVYDLKGREGLQKLKEEFLADPEKTKKSYEKLVNDLNSISSAHKNAHEN